MSVRCGVSWLLMTGVWVLMDAWNGGLGPLGRAYSFFFDFITTIYEGRTIWRKQHEFQTRGPFSRISWQTWGDWLKFGWTMSKPRHRGWPHRY